MRAVAGLITGAQIDRPGLSPVCLNKILSPALTAGTGVRLDEVNGKGPPGLRLISFMFAMGVDEVTLGRGDGAGRCSVSWP
jgi:hypothetical protein